MLSFLQQALTSLLSFLAGLWAGTYLQDRDTRRRHLGIVRALRAEISRIRREAGLDRPELIPISIFGATPLLPKPGSWVEALLADIASTAPEVVTEYLELDRCLDNLSATDKMKDATETNLREKRAVLERAEEAVDSQPLEKLSETLPAVFKADLDVERAQHSQELGGFVAETGVRQARVALEALERTLATLESELAAGLTTHLPWRRR